MNQKTFKKSCPTAGLTAVFFLATAMIGDRPADLAEIDVRISVKYILDINGDRPPGTYTTDASIRNIFDQINRRTLDRWNRGYRYVITEIQEIDGQWPFFNIDSDGIDSEFRNLENTAEANPGEFFWRTNAVNLFIVNSLFLVSGFAGGAAAIPSNPNDAGYRLVVFTADVSPPEILWPHELGHHFDLYHTFNNDGVADTLADPNPLVCSGMPSSDGRPCSTSGSAECCCATKLSLLNTVSMNGGWTQQQYDDIRFNNMSYHCGLTLDNLRMSVGQLDRWTDATRLYHSGEVSGFTYFVQRSTPVTRPYSGLSTDPYPNLAGGVAAANPGGGDIVLLRTGNYNEPMTITKPLTLRASRGDVTIGQ